MDKIVMIEAGANEVDEDTMLDAIKAAHVEIKKVIGFINSIVAERGKPKIDFQVVGLDMDMFHAIKEKYLDDFKAAMDTDDKNVRDAALLPIMDKIAEEYPDPVSYTHLDAINDVTDAMKGMLAPKFREVSLGELQVRQVYKISNVGTVAGCRVTSGKITRDSKVRVVRDGIVITEDEICLLYTSWPVRPAQRPPLPPHSPSPSAARTIR